MKGVKVMKTLVEGREIIPWKDRVTICSNFAEDVHKPWMWAWRAGRANREEFLTIHGMRLVINS